MENKLIYTPPKINLFQLSSIDIITSSGNDNIDTPPSPETDWDDDNVIGDGWV